MAVKSSTKKRLVELGIDTNHAHKLADDANMDAIKRMTVEEVAEKAASQRVMRHSRISWASSGNTTLPVAAVVPGELQSLARLSNSWTSLRVMTGSTS